ncbi:hypothetical protein KC19_11G008700 [Ceratodon purpureus]|uniref:Uncharacterized protein n=1 Tax=Ceratodon purpureus TaxID=3225 RepID=A0A8T0GBI7_CERPU|nr:hypothetical protein KC19_11G008700 [Ceratodon purpureus]
MLILCTWTPVLSNQLMLVLISEEFVDSLPRFGLCPYYERCTSDIGFNFQ